MRKSRNISLVLIGTIALSGMSVSGCGPTAEDEVHADLVKTTQNHYNTVEDCRKDWGTDPQDCTPNPHGGSGFVSPVYIWSHGAGYPTAVYPNGATRVLPNSYLAKGAQPTTGATALTSSMMVPKNSAVSGVAAKSGAVVSRGGFGSSSGHASGGG